MDSLRLYVQKEGRKMVGTRRSCLTSQLFSPFTAQTAIAKHLFGRLQGGCCSSFLAKSLPRHVYHEWLLRLSLIKPKFDINYIEILSGFRPGAAMQLWAISEHAGENRMEKKNHWEIKQFPVSQRLLPQSRAQSTYEEFTSKNLNEIKSLDFGFLKYIFKTA